ncbi:hypothetical protein [Streptomyces sioyaensis]|uniref:hypothetical protein n=1 Tax=Streptomyces sioyaensis TaxID=67364 RepID=UPI00379ACD88
MSSKSLARSSSGACARYSVEVGACVLVLLAFFLSFPGRLGVDVREVVGESFSSVRAEDAVGVEGGDDVEDGAFVDVPGLVTGELSERESSAVRPGQRGAGRREP